MCSYTRNCITSANLRQLTLKNKAYYLSGKKKRFFHFTSKCIKCFCVYQFETGTEKKLEIFEISEHKTPTM